MARQKRLTGLNPLAYLGVDPSSPAQHSIQNRAPTTRDYDNWNVMAVWLDSPNQDVYILVDKSANVATWAILATGTGDLEKLTADDANVVTPTAGNINIVGGGANLTTTGTAGPNSLTVSLAGITQFSVQVGAAANDLTQIVNGTTGQVLTANTGTNPTWEDAVVPSYSTGTFTPVLDFGGGTTGITYSVQYGQFTKIGNLVFVFIEIRLTSKGSSTGAAKVTGLPFTLAAGGSTNVDILMTLIKDVTPAVSIGYHGAVQDGTTECDLKQDRSGAAGLDFFDTNFVDASVFKLQGSYFTT